MTDAEQKLTRCLRRTAQAIRDYTVRPIPPAWRKVLQDIAATIRETGVAILENQPYPPDSAAPSVRAPSDPPADTVIVGVHGGCVQWVKKGSPNLRVLVRDYDTDGGEGPHLKRDDAGDVYAEWEQ